MNLKNKIKQEKFYDSLYEEWEKACKEKIKEFKGISNIYYFEYPQLDKRVPQDYLKRKMGIHKPIIMTLKKLIEIHNKVISDLKNLKK